MAEDRLDPGSTALVQDAANDVYISAVTIWEIEIKRALGRLPAPDDIVERVDESGFSRLPISFEHAREAGRLPQLHDDPFDRMLVAQARLEGLTLATGDKVVAQYDVPVLGVARV